MIRNIRGKVIEKGRESVVVDVCGFGIEVFCTQGIIERVKEGEKVELKTVVIFGEDPKVFGFEKEEERRVFEKLMGVSKVGPKTAMKIVSSSDLDVLVSAIKAGDVNALSKLPGIGKKTAERIVAELRGEFEDFEVEGIEGFSDAVEALQALGYSFSEASRAIREVAKKGMDVREMIREALRVLSKR